MYYNIFANISANLQYNFRTDIQVTDAREGLYDGYALMVKED